MRLILWFSIALAVGWYISGPVVDPDLWWHITAGRWIISHKEIPAVDHWGVFSEGHPWRAYSWLPEILFAKIDSVFGDHGLLVLQFLLGFIICFSFMYCLGKISNDWFVGGLFGAFCTLATFNHFTLRPQSLVWIYLAFLIFVVDSIAARGWSIRRAGSVFVIFVLWANTHLTAALGIGTVFLWSWNGKREKSSLILPLKLVVVSFLGTLLTPYLGGEWITFFQKSGHPFMFRVVAEFHAADITQYSTGFLLLILVLFLGFLHKVPKSLEGPKLLLGIGFVFAALAVVKFLPFAVLIIGALISLVWRRSREGQNDLGNLGEAITHLKGLFLKIPKEGLTFVCFAFAFMRLHNIWDFPIDEEIVPVKAVDFIEKNKLPLPVLGGFGHGGYLMYRFSEMNGTPKYKVAIDGRTNLIGDEVWKKFIAASHGRMNWYEFLTLGDYKTVLWRLENPLGPLLLATGDWCLLFSSGKKDQGFGVFVSKNYVSLHLPNVPSEQCGKEARLL